MTGASWIGSVLGRLTQDRTAVLAPGERWSARRLATEVLDTADWLDALDLPPGRPVPALLESAPGAIALVIAGAATGHPIAPIGPRHTVTELVRVLDRLPGTVLLCTAESFELAAAVAARTGRRPVLLKPSGRASDQLSADPVPGRLEALQHGLPAALAAADGVVLVLHTSGTTGDPRRVDVSDSRLAARARHNAALLELGPESRYGTASPLHHIAGIGMLAVALAAGVPVVLTARFGPTVWSGEWVAAGVTHALLVPSMVVTLLAEGVLPAPQLEVLQYGAAPMPIAVLREAMRMLPGARFVQFFGQTEGSPVTCLTAADHLAAVSGQPHLLRSVGRAAPGVELRIEQPDAHGVGEVVARGEHLFRLDADGWLRTGDLGRLDARGYLELVGRRGDKIIRGGENVYPAEVEEAIMAHPAVREAAVVGAPDHRLGEVVDAYVVLRAGVAAPDETELAEFVRSRLAGYKVPARWTVLDQLPRNATGKVLRRALAPPMRGADELTPTGLPGGGP